MQVNGKTEADIQAEYEERIKEHEEYVKAMKLKRIDDYIENNVGAHYINNFDKKKIREKDKLDSKINDMFETGKGIIIFGDVGVGKTMDLVYTISRIYKEQPDYNERDTPEIPISYYFMPALFNLLHQGGKPAIKKYVILDDWGREYATDFSFSQFEGFIEEIYGKEIRLVITTNLTKEQFLNRDGWLRITDRVREMCSMLEIPGRSMRHK